MGDIWKSVSRYTADEAKFPGEVGTYRDLKIIADERWASLVVTSPTSNETYSLAFEYVQPGGPAGDSRATGLFTSDKAFPGTGDRNWEIG